MNHHQHHPHKTHHNGPGYNQDFTDEDYKFLSHVEDASNSHHHGYYLDQRLGGLPGLAFLVFLIYAVAVSNTSEVTEACGSSLWMYMLVRLIFLFVGFCLMVCVGGIIWQCMHSPGATVILLSVIGITYYAVMLGVGAPIVTNALGSSSCVSALSKTCFTNSPMLAIIGCIFIGFDGLGLLFVIGAAVFFSCVARADNIE